MEDNRIDIDQLFKNIRFLENQELNANAEQRYNDALQEGNQDSIREAAMSWIIVMDGKNFQERLFGGTIPEFERETEKVLTEEERVWQPVPRQTNHPCCRLTEEDFAADLASQGYIHREQLRYCSVKDFIENYYYE